MGTSLTIATGLLAAALSLLNFVQQHPELPQASRDQAKQVAQHAITQATNSLAGLPSKSTATTTVTSPASTTKAVNLSISLENIVPTSDSAQIFWKTNLPTYSKIAISRSPAVSNASTTQFLPSVNGKSTKGLVSVSNLFPNTKYDYTIETTSGDQPIKIVGSFLTAKSEQQLADDADAAYKRSLPICPVVDKNRRCYNPARPNCILENGHPQCGG